MELAEMNELCKVYEATDDFENGIAMSKQSIRMAEDFLKTNQPGVQKQDQQARPFSGCQEFIK